MKVSITGAGGQLGRELQVTAPVGVTVLAFDSSQLDITDQKAVLDWTLEHKPDLVINAAAYTAVDGAEVESDNAHRVNGTAPRYLAEGLARSGGRLCQISTDYVFDGAKRSPYVPADATAPLNEYGKSKLEGERHVLDTLDARALVIRTSWLYSGYGRNFVLTMLKLMREKNELNVVSDQTGSPTWARGLAHAVWAAAARPALHGVFHWADSGETSWFGFASAIHEEALALGLLTRRIDIRPISGDRYPTLARRPVYSALDAAATCDKFGVMAQTWRASLRQMLDGLHRQGLGA